MSTIAAAPEVNLEVALAHGLTEDEYSEIIETSQRYVPEINTILARRVIALSAF